MNVTQLHSMVNQIARNFAIQGDEAAIVATAEHIRLFWEPRMRAAIMADDRAGLSSIAAAAVDRLG